jgi:predicted unusual protein kinase regulating ubiquinone biosynthesis (AarF/ABC1/UbiB family)
MKVLQNECRPFPSRVAFRQILADLDWEGPLAPGFPAAMANDGPPLFAEFDPHPVAAASLGQVGSVG